MGLNVQLLRESFSLVVENEPELAHRFYDTLFQRHPEALTLFRRNPRSVQERMLTDMLVKVMEHLDDEPWLKQELMALGAKHDGYGVTTAMYDWVGGALLKTLEDVAGSAWTPELGAAWTEAYGAIAGLMQAGAAQARA